MNMYMWVGILLTLVFSGCSSIHKNNLTKYVGKKEGYVNHYNQSFYEITTNEDIEDVVVYLPKNTTTIRLKMKVSNLEDVIYMKLVTEDNFEIDKILRRVENLKMLGYKQDGYYYEPSIEKNIVTLQVYIPSAYVYEGIYKPKLVFSFKRNSRSVQEIVNLNFIKKVFTVVNDTEKKLEVPRYKLLIDDCKSSKVHSVDFLYQLDAVNRNRIDEETIEGIKRTCK